MTNVQTELAPVTKTNHEMISGILNNLSDPDLLAVCGVAVIGLLLTVVLARLFPITDVVNLIALVD